MAENSKIEWTDHTFNPWWGCQEAGPGCDGCYARSMAERFHPKLKLWGPGSSRLVFTTGFGKGEEPDPKHWNAPLGWNKKAEREGVRRRVFCLSMGDWADNHPVAAEQREHLWPLIRRTPWLDWLLLTKRIGNAKAMLPANWSDGYANVWLGATIVNQEEADRDIPKLLAIPARVRFLSMEPLLGPVDLSAWLPIEAVQPSGNPWRRRTKFGEPDSDLGWVIAGGESGHGARPMHPEWARSLRDQCAAAGVPFLFKQWGEWLPSESEDQPVYSGEHRFLGGHAHVFKVGKKAAGRLLDGMQHDGFPR